MYCPVCPSEQTKVIDSRVKDNGMTTRRRRECVECDYRFSTKEEAKLLGVKVIKNDDSKEEYDRRKLKSGILRSLTKRPYESEELNQLIRSIERDIQKQGGKEVESRTIGKIVMQHLRDFDQVAYIRFASIYREFEDVNKFEHEIQSLNN
ncbi:MAG: transcriptional regulator NrdR [Parcubacteria group bacterium QH_9_35_7]|nr:MAG: transcriptional regulator NrdR [Parcubacteria group bacterium QH_9_35_7]